ncbi:MAG: hypothetical protein BGO88_04945 [Flavobacterium sp. 38-13]|mgnify:CR=1 FL=1|nr:MAG: hypothetical protein BGO88_04945 [Flavobacterium sp. 38-13]
MKNYYSLAFLFIFFNMNSQIDSLKMNVDGFPKIENQLSGVSKSEIHDRVKSWINRTFREPANVLKAEEKGSYIRIAATSSFTFKYMGNTTYDYDYNVEIDINDESWSYRIFDVSMYRQRIPEYFYDSKGRMRTGKMYLKIRESFLNDVNRIYFSLNEFINK